MEASRWCVQKQREQQPSLTLSHAIRLQQNRERESLHNSLFLLSFFISSPSLVKILRGHILLWLSWYIKEELSSTRRCSRRSYPKVLQGGGNIIKEKPRRGTLVVHLDRIDITLQGWVELELPLDFSTMNIMFIYIS